MWVEFFFLRVSFTFLILSSLLPSISDLGACSLITTWSFSLSVIILGFFISPLEISSDQRKWPLPN